MSRYVLDTDHVSLYQKSSPLVFERVRSMGASNLMITAITVEESTGGWLSEIHKAFEAQGGQRLNWAYTELCQCVQTLNEFQMLEYSIAAQEQFLTLRQQRIRIGTQDLRIAAICLGNDLTLVTRNRRDFEQVPGLNLEDWSC